MLLNIDNFKNINNLYNRHFGDEVLRIIAHKVQTLIPITSELYRLDNDEFAVLFRKTSHDEMHEIYQELKKIQKCNQGKAQLSQVELRCMM